MLRNTLTLCFALAIAPALLAAPPRLTFVRTVPAPHDLGDSHRLAVLYALGDNERVSAFVDYFVDQANRSSAISVIQTAGRGRLPTERPDEATMRRLRKKTASDKYLGVNAFTCETVERHGEGSTHDVNGARVRLEQHWIDATCRARVDILDGDGKRLFSYHIHGDGTSPRVAELTVEETNIALDQAARYAAISAAEEITPRMVRESVELDPAAPGFDDGMSMIDLGRLEEAESFWRESLKQHHDNAALLYNLGAISEALGTVEAARGYYEQASRLSPAEDRYRYGLIMFKRRNVSRPAPGPPPHQH